MKLIPLILFLLFFEYSGAQNIIYNYCFDQVENCANYTMSDPEPVMTIDITTNPNNIWQIGAPQKTVFNSAFSTPNVIITDTVNSYPSNDTSIFTIESTAIQSSSSVNWYHFNLSFKYFVDSDTLADFGSIEFSPDNGTTWIDLINDANYSSYLEWTLNGSVGTTPNLSGTSNGWMEANLRMRELGILLNIQPGTVFLWRFSFISDSIQNNREGLMYDNISVEISPPIGLEENNLNENKQLVKVLDLFGRETEIKPNTALIYLFSDGTTQKVFRVD